MAFVLCLSRPLEPLLYVVSESNGVLSLWLQAVGKRFRVLLEGGRAKTVAILESFPRGRTEVFLVLNSIPQYENGALQHRPVPHEKQAQTLKGYNVVIVE